MHESSGRGKIVRSEKRYDVDEERQTKEMEDQS